MIIKTTIKFFEKNELSGNGIIAVDALLQPQKARYIKMMALNNGIIPKGEYSGEKALLLIGEVQAK